MQCKDNKNSRLWQEQKGSRSCSCIRHKKTNAKDKKKADSDLPTEPILTKLGTVENIRDSTPHDNFGHGSATLVVCAHT